MNTSTDASVNFIKELCRLADLPLRRLCSAKQLTSAQTNECLNAVFLAAEINAETLRTHPNPEAWFIETCSRTILRMQTLDSRYRKKNTSLEQLRADGAEFAGVSIDGSPYTEALNGYTAALSRKDLPDSKIMQIKQEVLSALSQKELELYRLAYVEDLSAKEAA
ncbi:MAG: hypothetical protein IK064_04210, partial [Clostridia bacterium]|nr:hypothetical protein [Clostridia bacterium]